MARNTRCTSRVRGRRRGTKRKMRGGSTPTNSPHGAQRHAGNGLRIKNPERPWLERTFNGAVLAVDNFFKDVHHCVGRMCRKKTHNNNS